jgi:hypothetical protein
MGVDVQRAENISYTQLTKCLTIKIQRIFNIFVNRERQTQLNTIENPVIVNVGAGAGTLDLVLAQHYPSARFYLVDKEKYTLQNDSLLFTDNRITSDTVFQNSWEPFEDGVVSSGLDRNRFSLLDPRDEWPDEIDLVTSIWSWGWHYNYPRYIDRLKNIKIGGTVILTVLTLPESSSEFIGAISDSMNCVPAIHSFSIPMTDRSGMQYENTDQHGGIYIWKKK